MSGKWVLPAWTGPDSPQTPVPVEDEPYHPPGSCDACAEPPDLSQYQVTPIAACPECLADCISEGRDGWYCTSCKRLWTWQQVAYFEDGDTDRD